MPCVTRDTVNLELAELSDHAWIGFTDKGHEGRWTWEYGCESDFTNWLPGEPNDYGGDAAYGSGYGYGYYCYLLLRLLLLLLRLLLLLLLLPLLQVLLRLRL